MQVRSKVLAEGPPDWLVGMARTMAANNGDPAPRSARLVATTRQAAMDLSQAHVDSNQPVYFVVLVGSFVDTHGRQPPGVPDSRGSILAFTVDVQTRIPLDFALGATAPHLSELGAVDDFSGKI